MATCDGCGAHVSAAYARVFGVGGELHGCPACVPNGGQAAAARRGAEGP